MVFLVADCVAGSQVFLVVLEVFVPQTASIGVGTLLDALPTVGDASCRVPRVDDVAFVACRTVERLVSVLCCAARFSLQNLLGAVKQPAISSQPSRFGLNQPVQHWWRLNRLQAGVDAAVVAASFVALAL